MSKPTITYKFLMETNPFGRKVMTNVAEVVAFMAKKATAEGKKVPVLKYITGGKTLCEKQIANLDVVVKWMYDNWAEGDKGEGEGKIPKPTYAYATEGVKPMAIPYIENMTEVVEAIFNTMEDPEEEGDSAEDTEDPGTDPEPPTTPDAETTYTYTKVNKDETPVPEAEVTYYVKDGEGVYVEGGVVDGWFVEGDVYIRSEG